MQEVSSVAGRSADELLEVFVEMRGHLYLHAGTLLLKLAQDRQQTWRAVRDLAALCYLLAYQVVRHQMSRFIYLCSCYFKYIPVVVPSCNCAVPFTFFLPDLQRVKDLTVL